MRFLIKMAFWLSVVILFLPEDPGDEKTANFTTSQAVVAMHQAYSDLSGFCVRNPQTCDMGRSAAGMFERKARYGAKLLYKSLNGEPDDELATGSIQGTLKQSDLRPEWRKPQTKQGNL